MENLAGQKNISKNIQTSNWSWWHSLYYCAHYFFVVRARGDNSDEIHQSLCHTCCELVSYEPICIECDHSFMTFAITGVCLRQKPRELVLKCTSSTEFAELRKTFLMFIFRNKQTNYPEDEPTSTVKQIRRQCIWSFLVENISGWISQWWMIDENVSVMSRRGRSTSSRMRFQLSRQSVRSRGTPSIYFLL